MGRAWPPTQATWSTSWALDTTFSPFYSLWASFLTSRGFTCYIWILKHSCLLFPEYSHHLFVTSQPWECNTGSAIQPSEAQIQWWGACRLLGAWGSLGTKLRASDTRNKFGGRQVGSQCAHLLNCPWLFAERWGWKRVGVESLKHGAYYKLL